MCPAQCPGQRCRRPLGAEQGVVTGIGVGLEDAAIAGEVRERTLGATVARVRSIGKVVSSRNLESPHAAIRAILTRHENAASPVARTDGDCPRVLRSLQPALPADLNGLLTALGRACHPATVNKLRCYSRPHEADRELRCGAYTRLTLESRMRTSAQESALIRRTDVAWWA